MDDNGGADFTLIQEAIYAASDGDIIYVSVEAIPSEFRNQFANRTATQDNPSHVWHNITAGVADALALIDGILTDINVSSCVYRDSVGIEIIAPQDTLMDNFLILKADPALRPIGEDVGLEKEKAPPFIASGPADFIYEGGSMLIEWTIDEENLPGKYQLYLDGNITRKSHSMSYCRCVWYFEKGQGQMHARAKLKQKRLSEQKCLNSVNYSEQTGLKI